jgi:beta-N-acetylhexosaminidase
VKRAVPALVALALLSGGCASGGVAPTTLPSSTTAVSKTTTTATTLATTTTSLPPAPTTTTLPPTTTTAADVAAMARVVLMVGLAGLELDPATAAHLAAGGRGILLLAPNISTATQVSALTRQAACAAAGPLLVAVDQELGPVARLGGLVTPLPTIAEALAMTPLELEITAQLLGEEMLGLGINVDLAPVLDVVSGASPALADRYLGSDPDVVAEWGTAFWRGLEQAGVVAVPKHFPGHGRAAADPHYEEARITAPLADLEAVDFVPFRAAFAAGARAVMVGHPTYDALDPDHPASLSPAVLAVLRDDFGFDGVALSDALNMAAVASALEPGPLAVAALAAGMDLLLVVDPAVVEETVAAIVAAVAKGDLPLGRLQEAAGRVVALAEAAAPIACEA